MKKILTFLLLSIVLSFGITSVSYATVNDSNTDTVDSVLSEDNSDDTTDTDVGDVEWAEEDSDAEATDEENSDDTAVDSDVSEDDSDDESDDEGIYAENPDYSLNGMIPHGFPEVSIEDAIQWLQRKGGELINLFQVSGFYLVIYATIACLIVAAFGALTRRGGITGIGLGGVIICAIIYVLIYVCPYLLEWFRVWAVS